MPGEFVPKCAGDGSYERTQYHESYYWCVDKDGKELNGTRTRFKKPVCDAQAVAMKAGEFCDIVIVANAHYYKSVVVVCNSYIHTFCFLCVYYFQYEFKCFMGGPSSLFLLW